MKEDTQMVDKHQKIPNLWSSGKYVLGSSSWATAESGFLLMCILEVAGEASRTWAPVTQVGKLLLFQAPTFDLAQPQLLCASGE